MLLVASILTILDEGLVHQEKLANFTAPTEQDLTFLRSWMEDASMGAVYLTGRDQHVWHQENRRDCVVLRSKGYEDFLSNFIARSILQPFDAHIGKHFRVLRLRRVTKLY